MKNWKLVVGASLGVVVLLLAVCNWPGGKVQPNTQLIDYLQQKNIGLEGQNKILAQANAITAKQRDSILADRDSLKAVSDSATRRIRRDRAALPPAPVVPDSMLRFMYAQAKDLLDQSIADNERLHLITVDDSLAMGKMFKIEVNDSLRILNLEQEVDNTKHIANDWHKQFDDLNAARHPKCGRKCGIVLGVLATIGTAIGIHQVQETLK